MVSQGEPLEPVTVIVSRHIVPGKEAAYEAWLRDISEVALGFPGHLGMTVFRPRTPGEPYTLVYKFDTGEHLDAWLHSHERQTRIQHADSIIQSEPVSERLTGLETWFTLPGNTAVVPPPRWKMAVATVLAVYPVSLLLGALARRTLGFLPLPLLQLIITLSMVGLLTWVVMPRVTHLLRRWLYGPAASTRGGNAVMQ